MCKKRITFFYLGTKGAGPVYSIEMANALVDNGCVLQIFVSSYVTNLAIWKERFLDDNNVELNVIDTYVSRLGFMFSLLNWICFYNIKKRIDKFSPDIIYSSFSLLWGFILYRILRKYRIITTIHDVIPHNGDSDSFFVKLSMFDSIRKSDDLVILNHKDVETVEKIYRKSIKNVCVIPHASYSYYKIDNISNIADPSLTNTILFLGRIERYKGIKLLLDSFVKLKQHKKDLKLIIAGNGDISPYIEIIEDYRDSIELINRWIEDDEFEGIIRKCDFLVLPYLDASQSGIVPLAFAFGKPVVATNVGALSEQVPLGTGFLIRPNEDELIKAILLMYDNADQIIKFGQNAQRYANDELSWNKSAKILIDYIS